MYNRTSGTIIDEDKKKMCKPSVLGAYFCHWTHSNADDACLYGVLPQSVALNYTHTHKKTMKNFYDVPNIHSILSTIKFLADLEAS